MGPQPQEVDDYDGADEAIRYDLCRWCGRSEGHTKGCPDDGVAELLERGPRDLSGEDSTYGL